MPKEVSVKLNYRPYIAKVLHQVHTDNSISTEAINEVNLLIHDLAERLAKEASHLCQMNHRKTISSRDIMYAIRTVFPGELEKHAVSEGVRAVTKYTSSGQAKPQQKTNLLFSISRTKALIRHYSAVNRVSEVAPVYLAAALEYIVAEILELAGNVARDHKIKRISPRHLRLVLGNDEELGNLFRGITTSGGVLPRINAMLLPRRKH
jgi:histone H3/H4